MATNKEDKDALLKQAADLLDHAERKEQATKLAFSLVERGKIPPFDSFAALEEKVASLMSKDLNVVEQALELDVDLPDFGKVASENPDGGRAAAASGFEAATASFAHMLADEST